ncbi:MAG: thiosulfate oxidation carrier protein SoxY [Gammaproteobacteria bacterium]
MSIKRRTFLHAALAAAAAGMATVAGLLSPRALWATRPTDVFETESFDDVLEALGGEPAESGEIKIRAPDIAENGAVVPVTVQTTLDKVEAISIVVENNPNPLAASFDLTGGAGGMVSTRIKMAETSPVVAVVKADGKLYSAAREVKVTIGGCGG